MIRSLGCACEQMGAIETVMGKHSLGETRDLLAKTSYRFLKTDEAIRALFARAIELRAQGAKISEQAVGDLANDWAVLFPKWKTDEPRFEASLDRLTVLYPLNSDATIAAEDVWSELVLYLNPSDDFARGSLPDIARRIQAMGVAVDFSGEPRGSAEDWDHDVLKKSSSATKTLEETTKQVVRDYWPFAALGLVVAAGVYAPQIKAALRLLR